MSNGASLLSLVKMGIAALPAPVRLDISRTLIAYCTDVERNALLELGGEPVDETLDTEAESEQR